MSLRGKAVMEWSKAIPGASLALLLCGLGTVARADAIPYLNSGTPNPESYSFKAAATGESLHILLAAEPPLIFSWACW